ncbi:FimB/Mfa2 family fimbrial subunit [Flavobacterium sp. TSSA_36]|jgi:hypothetical protein|uniref:FimB/Mfa2 family fimbrial subunit n=1 Tax=Flavobacterium sp. TSSA_36 TaxID=3447669 RepID=UPI003F355A8F
MKTMQYFSLFVTLFMTSVAAFATEKDFFLNVKNSQGNEISFSMNGIESADIAIYDQENNLIFSEKAKGQNGIIKNYNLDELPMGNYTLVVKTNLKEVKHDIKVKSNTAVLSKKAYLEVYKSSFDNNAIVSK